MPMSPPLDLQIIDYVLQNKTSLAVPCQDDAKVHAKICHLNRWRQQILDYRPELTRLRFCRRSNPPRILVEYDMTYEVELQDSEGNPLGFSISDLDQQAERDRQARIQAEKEEQLANVSQKKKEKFLRELAESTGLSVEAIRQDVEGGQDDTPDAQPTEQSQEPSLTEEQESALAAAEQQKGDALTETEREHILNATAPDSLSQDDSLADL